jgi:deoxyribonuclease V
VNVAELHSWQVGTKEAISIQRYLAKKVCCKGNPDSISHVAGVDISVNRALGTATAAVIVLKYPELYPVEVRKAEGKLTLPYIPGLLSFRESPLILEACRLVEINPGLIIVDGQGIAHPRRMGLACHLGLFLDIPTIGCAKSLLCGKHHIPGDKHGQFSEIVDGGENIGVALRTKNGVKPVFISPGHLIDLESALRWTLDCCRGYRLPEPTRLAHLAAGGNLKADSYLEMQVCKN